MDDNNLTLDGVDATAVFNQMQREYVRLTIPLESIDQFDVKDQTFGADVEGGTAGGQVAVVSPSGTNSLHGNAFDYFRNDAIEARTPFSGPSPNPFLLNQFGGAIGGPIVRNKLFFYATYEGLRQRLDGTQIGLTAKPEFHCTGRSSLSRAIANPPRVSGRNIAYRTAERLELHRTGTPDRQRRLRNDPPRLPTGRIRPRRSSVSTPMKQSRPSRPDS